MDCARCQRPLHEGDGHVEIVFFTHDKTKSMLGFCKGVCGNEARAYLAELAKKLSKPVIEIDLNRPAG